MPSCQSVKFESVVDVTVSLDSHFDSLVFAYGFKIDTFRSINITWGKVSEWPGGNRGRHYCASKGTAGARAAKWAQMQ